MIRKYFVFLFVVVIVSFLHLYFSQKFYMWELLQNVKLLDNDFCTKEETKHYCEDDTYKVFPYLLDKENNIVFLHPSIENSIKIEIDWNYIKSYLYYLMLNFKYRFVDILLLSIIIAFAISFLEYSKYYFTKDTRKDIKKVEDNQKHLEN